MAENKNTQESALTAPSDRDPSKNYRPNQSEPPLNNEETKNALDSLNKTAFIKRFRSVERKYVDPVLSLQRIGLISFIPAKGATPNGKGVYGFAKLRGNYATEEEANERAEFLIRNFDSYHQIFHTYVGRPFPLTTSSDYSENVDEVDLKQQMKQSVSHDIKQKRLDEQKEIREIQQQEQKLLEESKREEEDPHERYTELRVKKAQVSWTYLETEKKMEEMKDVILKTHQEIEEMEKEDPTYKEQYFKKYMEARQRSGFTANPEEMMNNFMRFMIEDADLPFLPKKAVKSLENKSDDSIGDD